MNNSGKVKISGLWRNESKNGMVYYAGITGRVKYLVFPVTNADNPNAPQFELFVAQHEAKSQVEMEVAPKAASDEEVAPKAASDDENAKWE